MTGPPAHGATPRAANPAAVDYHRVFDTIPSPCAVLSPELVVLDVNLAYCTVTGRLRRELLGSNLLERLPRPVAPLGQAPDTIENSLRRALGTGCPDVLALQRYRVRSSLAQHGAGADRYWVCTATPLCSHDGTLLGVLHKIQDVTPIVLSHAMPDPDTAQPRPSRSDIFTIARELQEANAALDQARERERETSLTLQLSMLPAGIPAAAAGRVAARYLPAVTALSVGGDWYDVALLSDGRLAFAVGDVVGHGLAAAAIMGQLRSALSALTVADVGPARALQVLDTIVEQMEHAVATTAVKVVIDLDAGTATYSSAGHLPPLLHQPDGCVHRLDQALGPPLAASAATRTRPQAVAQFREGAILVLC